MYGQEADSDYGDLSGDEEHQPFERGVHEAIGVQADAQHVDAKPGETSYDVAENGKVHNSTITNDSTPASMEDQRIPNDDQERTIHFGIPTPKTSPGLIGPDASQDSAS